MSSCREELFASIEHDPISADFAEGATKKNAKVWRNIVGTGDGWRFAELRNADGYLPFANPWVVEKIIRCFVTNRSSLYHRLMRTLEEFPSLRAVVDPDGLLEEVFLINAFLFGLVCVSSCLSVITKFF